MGTFLQDLRYALHTLARTPAFPLAAIITLAIGIGATTAIFSTVNAVLLKPLPYPHPSDLYSLRTTLTDGRVTTGLLSPVEIVRLNDPKVSIVKAAGLSGNDVTLLRNDGTPLKTRAYAVTEGFFDVFGLPMTLGAYTKPAGPGNNAPPTVIISYRMWQDLYGGDPAVVGKPIRFAEIATTVAGVASREFDTPEGANFWFQVNIDPQGVAHNFEGYMRTKPGVSIERVKQEMTAVMDGVAHDFPDSAKSRIYLVRPLVESIVGELGPILVVVLSATGVLLLLACVNVTNLLLARGATRAREIAVRVAIGAGRGRIVRQLLTESMLLATAGAVVGIAAAYAFVQLLLRVGASQLPRLDAVSFDSRVLLFALAALVVSGLLVGFAPALRLAGTDIKSLMNEGGRSSGGPGTTRWLGALTSAEIALAVALVAGAGWLVRSFDKLSGIDPGFTADGRMVFDIGLQGPNFRDNTAVNTAFNQLLERLRGLNGVVAAGSTLNFPLRSGPENSLFVHLQGDPMDSAHNYNSRQRSVSPGFFSTMNIKLISGRDFNDHDIIGSPSVAVVNRAFVARYLSGKDPLAVQFTSGYPNIDTRNVITIVGVVEDVRQRSLNLAGEPAYYTTSEQGTPRRQSVVIHTRSADLGPLRSAIRDEVRKVDPQIPVDVERVSDIVGSTLNRQRLGMTLMLVFAGAAIALAAVGIYGVIAYSAAQQRRDVAIRLALGATQGNVFWLVVKQGRTLAMIGTGIGLIIAYLAGRVVTSSLYEVRESDPMILGAAAIIVVGIALLATVIPAFRAARLNPSNVLRSS